MLTRSLILKPCALGHPTRYDIHRGRLVCDTCEGAGRKERKASPAAKGSAKGGKPNLSLVPSENNGATPTAPASEKGRIRTRAMPQPKPDKITEEVIQNDSAGALRNKGYLVLVNSVKLKAKHVTCKNCGDDWWEQPNFSTGQTPGVPDLSVSKDSWHHPLLPARAFWGIEQKGPTTQVSPEQQVLRDDGFTVVAKSQEQNLAVTAQVDHFFSYLTELEQLKSLCADSTDPAVAALLRRLASFQPMTPINQGRKKKTV